MAMVPPLSKAQVKAVFDEGLLQFEVAAGAAMEELCLLLASYEKSRGHPLSVKVILPWPARGNPRLRSGRFLPAMAARRRDRSADGGAEGRKLTALVSIAGATDSLSDRRAKPAETLVGARGIEPLTPPV